MPYSIAVAPFSSLRNFPTVSMMLLSLTAAEKVAARGRYLPAPVYFLKPVKRSAVDYRGKIESLNQTTRAPPAAAHGPDDEQRAEPAAAVDNGEHRLAAA